MLFHFIAEHDIFGEALSDSEDEETNNNLLALDEDNSRLSCEDSSRLSDSVSLQVCLRLAFVAVKSHTQALTCKSFQQSHSTGRNDLVTEFRKEMFTNNDDFVVQMSNIKTEVYEYEPQSSVSSNQDFSIKSEVSIPYVYEVGKNDDQNKFTTEYIPTESSTGTYRNQFSFSFNPKML